MTKFCYQVKVEFTTINVVAPRCAAQYLEVTNEFGDGNLIVKTKVFLQQVVFQSWLDFLRALESCSSLMPQVEELGIVKKLIHSIFVKACTDPSLVSWPIPEHQSLLQSFGGSVLWNGISTGARARAIQTDWWYDDLSILSLPLLERVVVGLEARGTRLETIVRTLVHYVKKSLLGLHMRHSCHNAYTHGPFLLAIVAPAKDDQQIMLETIEGRLPSMKGLYQHASCLDCCILQ